MKAFQLIVVALIAAAIVLVADKILLKSDAALSARSSVYERVLASGTLRCGYFEEAPFTIIDPNTGAKSGIAVELVEKAAEDLGFKVEWVGAANFGTMTEDLRSGRYDAICASVFNLPRAGRMDYTTPYAFVPIYGYTQHGRADFDGHLDSLDWTKITVAGLDGEGATTVARKLIPDAHFSILPQNAQIADMLTSVADKKADIGFVMPTVFKNFGANNPNRLTKIVSDRPFYVFNVSFGIKPDEAAFKNMLDFEFRNFSSNGFMDHLFKKYDPDNLLFRPAALYQ